MDKYHRKRLLSLKRLLLLPVLLLISHKTFALDQCSNSSQGVWKAINEFVGILPDLSDLQKLFLATSKVAQVVSCYSDENGEVAQYVTEKMVREMLDKFKKEIDEQRLDELKTSVSSFAVVVQTARTPSKIDSTLRTTTSINGVASGIGFPAIHTLATVGTMKLGLLTQLYTDAEKNKNSEEMKNVSKDTNLYLADLVGILNKQEQNLESYLNNKIKTRTEYESFTTGGDSPFSPITNVQRWQYFVDNHITGESKKSGWKRCSPGCSSESYFDANAWIRDQKESFRKTVKTKSYLNVKGLLSKYATMNFSDARKSAQADIDKAQSQLSGRYIRTPIGNDWHDGKIEITKAGQMQWRNKAGVSWKLNLNLMEDKLETGTDNPYYYQNNGRTFNIQRDSSGNITGFKFINEFYRQGTCQWLSNYSGGAWVDKLDIPKDQCKKLNQCNSGGACYRWIK